MDIAIVQYIPTRRYTWVRSIHGIVHIPTMHMYCTWHGWYIGMMAYKGTDGMPYPGYPDIHGYRGHGYHDTYYPR